MNKNYTLKELADIGGLESAKHSNHQKAREAFTKAILDAIGYEFPKDEEREAFEDWLKCNPCWDKRDDDVAFFAWKAGREELRRKEYLDKQPSEPAWIPWAGGECPLPDTVKRWECKFRGGWTSEFDYIVRGVWHHGGHINDIVAYRVLEG